MMMLMMLMMMYCFLSEFDFKKIHVVDSLKFKGHSQAARRSWASHVIVLYSTDRHTWLPVKSRYLEEWVNIKARSTHVIHV
jgi:hypothetical protein